MLAGFKNGPCYCLPPMSCLTNKHQSSLQAQPSSFRATQKYPPLISPLKTALNRVLGEHFLWLKCAHGFRPPLSSCSGKRFKDASVNISWVVKPIMFSKQIMQLYWFCIQNLCWFCNRCMWSLQVIMLMTSCWLHCNAMHDPALKGHFGVFKPGPYYLDLLGSKLLLRTINDWNLSNIEFERYNRQPQSSYTI